MLSFVIEGFVVDHDNRNKTIGLIRKINEVLVVELMVDRLSIALGSQYYRFFALGAS